MKLRYSEDKDMEFRRVPSVVGLVKQVSTKPPRYNNNNYCIGRRCETVAKPHLDQKSKGITNSKWHSVRDTSGESVQQKSKGKTN